MMVLCVRALVRGQECSTNPLFTKWPEGTLQQGHDLGSPCHGFHAIPPLAVCSYNSLD